MSWHNKISTNLTCPRKTAVAPKLLVEMTGWSVWNVTVLHSCSLPCPAILPFLPMSQAWRWVRSHQSYSVEAKWTKWLDLAFVASNETAWNRIHNFHNVPGEQLFQCKKNKISTRFAKGLHEGLIGTSLIWNQFACIHSPRQWLQLTPTTFRGPCIFFIGVVDVMIIFNTSNFYDCIDCIFTLVVSPSFKQSQLAYMWPKFRFAKFIENDLSCIDRCFLESICAKNPENHCKFGIKKEVSPTMSQHYDYEKLKMNAFWNCVDIKTFCTNCHPRLATIGIQQSIEQALLKLQGLGTMHGISKSRGPVLHKSTMSRRKLIRCKLWIW